MARTEETIPIRTSAFFPDAWLLGRVEEEESVDSLTTYSGCLVPTTSWVCGSPAAPGVPSVLVAVDAPHDMQKRVIGCCRLRPQLVQKLMDFSEMSPSPPMCTLRRVPNRRRVTGKCWLVGARLDDLACAHPVVAARGRAEPRSGTRRDVFERIACVELKAGSVVVADIHVDLLD